MFVHVDDVEERNIESGRISFDDQPNANSTLTTPETTTTLRRESFNNSRNTNSAFDKTVSLGDISIIRPLSPIVERHEYTHVDCECSECPDINCSSDVGHISHIPRTPPKPTLYTIPTMPSILSNSNTLNHIPRTPPKPSTYTVPSMTSVLPNRCNNTNKTTVDESFETKDLFGIVKLKDTDVCYTNGTIEWVGRKRGFPVNSGFKILDQESIPQKQAKPSCNKKECDCADVLPTVNAIVEHLNAIHEAVDIMDLRLNTLEDVMSKTH